MENKYLIMNKLRLFGIIFLLLIIILGISIIIINRSDSIANLYKLREKYPLLKEQGDILSLSGVVTKKDFSNNLYSRGTYLIDLTDGTKFALYGTTRNYLYESSDLTNFLYIGDSIYKPYSSDSIFIYRGDQKYYFILGKMINR